MLYHEYLSSEWIALYVLEIPQHFFSDISSLPMVIPVIGLFQSYIFSVISKVIWGEKRLVLMPSADLGVVALYL